MIVDSHCHLQDQQFEADRGDVVARAAAAGVSALVAPATDGASAGRALELARRTGTLAIGVAVGVHPNDLEAADRWSAIEDLAAEPEVVAIGETGLDYYRGAERAPEQRALFARHLDLAARRGLPVVVHNRAADQDVLAALSDWSSGVAGRVAVLHCFVGGPALAERALALGCYLGYGGPLTFKSAADLRETARVVPLERALVETDAPYLAPTPHRGQRNEPAYARLVVARLAEILELDFREVAAQTRDNALRVFGDRLGGAARPLARGLA